MWYLLKACIFLSGLFLVCAPQFLYEDEEGKIQNVLEDLWVKIDDNRNKLLSRHTVFMRVVAETTDSIFNRLFGKKLFSRRALFYLSFFSYASLFLSVSLFLLVTKYEGLSLLLILLAISFLYAIVGAIHGFIRKPFLLKVWYVWAFVLFGLPLLSLYRLASIGSVDFPISIICAIGLGIISDIFFIALTRRLLRWSAGLQSFYQIATVVFLNCLVAFVLVAGPYFLSIWILRKGLTWSIGTLMQLDSLSIAIFIFLMGAANSITALTALFFVVLALIMLMHRLFWPGLERPIYALQRVGIVRRRKLFVIIGVILMSIALGLQIPWLEVLKNL